MKNLPFENPPKIPPGGGWENGKKHGIGPSGWEICRKVDEEIAANADESSVRGPFQIFLCAQFAFRTPDFLVNPPPISPYRRTVRPKNRSQMSSRALVRSSRDQIIDFPSKISSRKSDSMTFPSVSSPVPGCSPSGENPSHF